MNGFGRFWFLNGGGIHGAWKQRNYSLIKSYALKLPELAWDEALEQVAKRVEESGKIEASQIREMKVDK